MWRSLTIFFASASLMALGCASAYRSLQPATSDADCPAKLRPKITVGYYRVDVDLMGRPLNGILVVKRMEDGSLRMVYTNGMGLTFFDMGHRDGEGFTVYRILEQLDKDAVVRTLEKDMKLLWMLDIPDSGLTTLSRDGVKYHLWKEGKDHYYYLTEGECGHLLRAERASSRKTIAVAETFGLVNAMPDSVSLTHHNLDMTIHMKRFVNEAP
jgi:hypothetical protein